MKTGDEALRLTRWTVLGAVCAMVVVAYARLAHSVGLLSSSADSANQYYNLLVQGFRSGELALKREPPPALAQLPDPYHANLDALGQPDASRIMDTSYYKGRLYLYFGVTPAVLLFWPFSTVTGHYVSHGQAVAIFCAVGFLAGATLLLAMWRRYFADMSVGVVAVCILAFGLATGVPAILPQCDVYEVAINCGYMLSMLALGAVWCALHDSERRTLWLATASAVCGLAMGARPWLALAALILAIPVAEAWRERRPIWPLLLAVAGPLAVIGAGLMVYNALRFDNPFEFGWHYQLAGPHTDRHFGWSYLWFNLRVYFLKSVGWSRHFPFVQDMPVPPTPSGHGNSQKTFGILTNIPLVWMALAMPLAWAKRSAETTSTMRWFLAAVTILFAAGASVFCFYYYSARRFEIEFLPALVLLSAVGVFGLERALANHPAWKCAARCGWGALVLFSVGFNLCAGVESYAVSQYNVAGALWRTGKSQEAIQRYEYALRIKPDFAQAHCDLGTVLLAQGHTADAIGHFEQALRLRPDRAILHYDLADALMRDGRAPEAIHQWEQALELKPDFAEAHFNLGIALEQAGRLDEAIGHFEQALRIRPDFANARTELARLRSTH